VTNQAILTVAAAAGSGSEAVSTIVIGVITLVATLGILYAIARH
jgi:hypothetical protein